MVSGLAVPGSIEFTNAFVQADTNNLQTALGTVKVTAVAPVDDQCIDITYRQGNGPLYVVRIDHGELNSYVFVPDTQLLIVPGAIKKQFPNHVHDYPGTVLTQSQKDEIAAFVLTMSPWI
jgi:hypothetical protein